MKFISDSYEKENCALILMAWINIEFIESVAIETHDDAVEDEDVATICNQLLEMTDKLESFTVFPTLHLVRLFFLS
jgi:hypothetical protein